MWTNARHAFRLMRRLPLVAAVVITSVAAGTCAASVVFTAVKAVLLEPLPYANASELLQIRTDLNAGNPTQDWVSWTEMLQVARRNSTLEAVGLYRYSVLNVLGDSGSSPEAWYGLSISAALFPTLGVHPFLGRNILSEEDRPNRSCVLILNYGLWVRRFNSDRNIIGRSVQANGHSCSIIGVMPPGFNFPMRLATTVRTPSPFTEFWSAPLPEPDPKARQIRQDLGYGAIGRLRRGSTPIDASQDLGRISADLAAEFPQSHRGLVLRALPMVDRHLGFSRAGLWLAFAASVLFLMIGCANVANLLLARGLARQSEFAIRLSVGAGRAHIICQLLVESLVSASIGGLLGWLLTLLVWQTLPSVAPLSIPRLAAARPDVPVFLFALSASLINGLLFGILPALRAAGRLDLSQKIKEPVFRGNPRSVLLGAEAALAVGLMIISGLLATNLVRLLTASPGFDARHVLASIIVPIGQRYPTPESREPFWRALLDQAKLIPGIESVGAIDALPFSGQNQGATVTTEREQEPARVMEVDHVSPGYLPTMNIELTAGRQFQEEDVTQNRSVSIIDEIAARTLWPGADAIGKRICVNCLPGQAQQWNEIVGIVKSTRHISIEGPPVAAVYLASRAYTSANFLVVGTQHSSEDIVQAVRRAVASIDPGQPVLLSASLSTLIGDSISDRRFVDLMITSTGILALLLAAVGVYGVVSHATSKRMREIAIRMALGAASRQILWTVMVQGIRPVLVGGALGIAVAAIAIRLLRGTVAGLESPNPFVFAASAGFVILTACTACFIPAARVSRLDPTVSLRHA